MAYLGLHFSDMALSMGPAVILESYQQNSTDPILHGDFDLGLTDVESDYFHGYITDPLRQIFEERKVVPPKGTEDYTQRKIVLDSVTGVTDECKSSIFHGNALSHQNIQVNNVTLFVAPTYGMKPVRLSAPYKFSMYIVHSPRRLGFCLGHHPTVVAAVAAHGAITPQLFRQ